MKRDSIRSELIEYLTYVVTELDEFDDDFQNQDCGSSIVNSELLTSFFRRNYEPGRILDVGCGGGGLFQSLPEITDGVEPNLHRLKNARKGKGTKVKWGCAENLPYREGEFDTVISWRTLCHVRSLVESLAEVNRVLRKRGVFIFDVVVDSLIPIVQTVNPEHFTNRYLPLFGFEVLEKREIAERETDLKVGIAARKLSNFDYTEFLLPQVVQGRLVNYKETRDWFLR